nr:reverse transcriptase domain-containing protein [Tanacetum cinerariifolium]
MDIKEKDKIKVKTGQNQARNGKHGKVNQVKAKVKVKPIKTGHGFGKSTKNQSQRRPPCHRTIAADYFFNNGLEYLKTSDPEVTYTTSITKTKAARYEIKGIEDMVPTLCSTIKNAYDKDVSMGIKHWGDFVDLHLNDIEDMLLLTVQHKLFHLDGSDIVDFIVALRMFTRSLICKRRVEDLQLGAESYQKKLNITKPQKTFLEIKFKEPYTPLYDLPGIVYEDLDKQKQVLQADELYKFSDGTLKSIHDEIYHRVLDFCLDYNPEMPKIKWTAVDRKRSGLMIELIDKQLRERGIIRNLERLVGASELEMDYKLMTRTTFQANSRTGVSNYCRDFCCYYGGYAYYVEVTPSTHQGYRDAIVILAILAENFELKVRLLTLVTSSQFHGFERDDPHSHIRWFNKITSTLKYKNVPHEAIKLMLFLFSLEGAARIWLEKEPPRSIHTLEDLVSEFVNYFFPPSKTTNLKNDITNFQQRFDETFSKAWDHFKDLIRKCPHYGFSKLHQIYTFYNALTQSDQDSLNAAAGGIILNRTPRDALTIIENKSKVRTSRNKPVVSKASATTSSSTPAYLSEITALTDAVKAMLLQNKTPLPAPGKAIEEICVTCRGSHPYYECLATYSNTFNASVATGTYNQGVPSNLQRLHFDLSFADALLPLPKFASTFKRLLSNKEKLFELANTPLNEICSAVLLKKFPKKLGDPGKHTSRYSYRYDNESDNRIDVIDVTCEEYAQEVLGFLGSSKSGNPTSSSDPIIVTSSSSLTPFDGGDYVLEEIETCLTRDLIPPGIDDADFDPEGDILLLKKHVPKVMMAIFHDMIEETIEVFMDDFSVFEDSFSSCLSHLDKMLKSDNISKSGIEVDRAKVDVIAKLPHPTSVKADDPSSKKTLFIFSKECIEAFEILKKKLSEASVLVAHDWDLPFEIMCDASDFAVGAILLLQEFNVIIRDKKGAKNLAANHMSRLENPHQGDLEKKEINETFPLETLGMISIHAKALPTNDARVVVKFLKSLFARFGTPRAIISNRSTHFCNDQFAKVMLKYGVTHRLSTAYHPKTSGQVEVSNHGLKRILQRTVGENQASWSDKLDNALWAFRTAFKTPIGCTPYKHVYEKACHLPIKLEHKACWALKHCNFDLKSVGDHQKVQMNEINKLRDEAYENSLIYKEKTKKIHDSKVMNRVFNVGDQVLLFSS